MAKVTPEIITILRQTAIHLGQSNAYQWGHMGCCNCGFLAQQVTALSPKEIHTAAMQSHGDWSEQLNDYCATSGMLMDDLITNLLNFGFDRDDLKHLERLSDPAVLEQLDPGKKHLAHNKKDDVIRYLNAWANLIEAQWLADVSLEALNTAPAAYALA